MSQTLEDREYVVRCVAVIIGRSGMSAAQAKRHNTQYGWIVATREPGKGAGRAEGHRLTKAEMDDAIKQASGSF